MHESNYGKYEVPQKLLDLIQLQEKLNAQGILQYGSFLGQYFKLEKVEMRYLNTPVDVIPFAWTGADGIHFGFLTDFGQVSSLDDAYIVRVSPMDFDEPVKLVARNLDDFVALMIYHRYVAEVLDTSSSKATIERYLSDQLTDETYPHEEEVVTVVYEQFTPKPIPSVHDYFKKLRDARAAAVVVETDDGIGVVRASANAINLQNHFSLERDMQPNLEQVQTYFEHSSLEYKLAFIRDAQSYGILFEEPLLKQFIIEELQRLNFKDEALRLGTT